MGVTWIIPCSDDTLSFSSRLPFKPNVSISLMDHEGPGYHKYYVPGGLWYVARGCHCQWH